MKEDKEKIKQGELMAKKFIRQTGAIWIVREIGLLTKRI